jgi:hypothetical protein
MDNNIKNNIEPVSPTEIMLMAMSNQNPAGVARLFMFFS